MPDLIEAAQKYYCEKGAGAVEVERLLELDLEEVGTNDCQLISLEKTSASHQTVMLLSKN